jgi:hypothetical protein
MLDVVAELALVLEVLFAAAGVTSQMFDVSTFLTTYRHTE